MALKHFLFWARPQFAPWPLNCQHCFYAGREISTPLLAYGKLAGMTPGQRNVCLKILHDLDQLRAATEEALDDSAEAGDALRREQILTLQQDMLETVEQYLKHPDRK